MAYRKLGRDNKHRRSMLATLTKQVINNESITTTDTRAKELRKFVDKMITYGKKGDLISRRKALAFLQNDTVAVKKVFEEFLSFKFVISFIKVLFSSIYYIYLNE